MFNSQELHEGSLVNDFCILTNILGRKIASKSVFVMFSFWWKFEEPFAKAKWANQKCASVHCCLDALAFVIFSLYKFDSLIDSKWANMMHSKPPPSTHAFTFTCFYFHFHIFLLSLSQANGQTWCTQSHRHQHMFLLTCHATGTTPDKKKQIFKTKEMWCFLFFTKLMGNARWANWTDVNPT